MDFKFKIKFFLSSFLVFSVFFACFLQSAKAAVLFFEPPLSLVGRKEKFQVILRLDPEGQVVNAIQGEIYYADNLNFISVNNGDSLIGLWIERPAERNGKIAFSGITPGGYAGDLSSYWSGYRPGKILSLVFSATRPGPAYLNVENVKVLLNDGRGTEAPLTVKNVELVVSENPTMAGAESASIQDKTPPEEFEPRVAKDANIFGGRWFLVFAAKDVGSGISHYEVREERRFWDIRWLPDLIDGENAWRAIESPYLLQNQNLSGFVHVKAVDNAKNERVEAVNPLNPVPLYENVFIWFIIVGAMVIVIFSVCKRNGKV